MKTTATQTPGAVTRLLTLPGLAADAFLRPRRLGAVLSLALCATAVLAGPQVPTLSVALQTVQTGQELDGVVEAVQQATVSAQGTGRVLRMLVKAGDKVRAGQVLATLDDRDTQAGMARSQAQVAQAQAEVAQAQAHVQRTRDLRRQGFVSQAALDQAEAQFQAAQAAREGAGAGAQQARLAQSFTQVSAPFDGHVLQTLAQAGDLAQPGKPLLTLYAPQPLRVVVQVPASMAAAARAAQRVQLQFQWPALQPSTGAGQGGAVGAGAWITAAQVQGVWAADPLSQTLSWRADVPADLSTQLAAQHAAKGDAPRGTQASSQASTQVAPQTAYQLLPGQSARVRFVGGAEQARLLIAPSAVLQRGELTAVYVVQGQRFVLRSVRLGASHAQGVEVLAGLQAGDRVAQNALQAGMAGATPRL